LKYIVEIYMNKRVIQVPVDETLLKDLNSLSKSQRKTRSALIREACQQYLKQAEKDTLDTLYQEGYKRIPEKPETGKAQISMAGEILPGESW
jgi:metal-responsive CopG/Arc/MetJ family transcriptional regulator